MPAASAAGLEGRPAAADPLATASARRSPSPRAGRSRSARDATAAISSSTAASRCVGHGRPAARRLGRRVASFASAPRTSFIEGFDIDGRGGGDLGRDSSGVHVAAERVTIRDCRIRNTLFGIYLREADGVRRRALPDPRHPRQGPGREGLGDPRLEHGRLQPRRQRGRGRARRLLHPVVVHTASFAATPRATFGTACTTCSRTTTLFEDNTFENGAAGTALMYSRRIVFRRNRFLHNRGLRVGRPALQGLRRRDRPRTT